jgi:hypothetical protein
MGIHRIVAAGKEVIIVNFAGLGEDGMIDQFTELKNIVMEQNKKQLIATLYTSRNFGTPRYMRHVRAESKIMIDRIDKIATVGLSATQKLLLKGLSFFFKRNFKTFDSLEDAVRYLIDDNTTDLDIPEYLKEL